VNQVWYAASDYGYYNTQQEYLTQLETVLSDDNSSLSGGFDNFFAALNEATTSPDDSALREQVISESARWRCVWITRWITSTRKAVRSSARNRRWWRR
jgi:flagellar hook-associated protein FlgK